MQISTPGYVPTCRRVAGAVVALGIAAAAAALGVLHPVHRATAATGSVRVPVLMYHYIRVNPVASDRLGFNLSVTPADFAKQMDYLQLVGAHTVSLVDAMDAIDGKKTLPARAVVLTFDDGYADFATAAEPIMAWHGFHGTAYVCPGLLGKPNYMTTDQLKRVAALGTVVGAHTVHHVDLPANAANVAWAEIKGSRDQLRVLTGQPVDDFAYPYGHLNTSVIAMVERAGFRDATTTMPGTTLSAGQRFVLPRVRVGGGESLADFAASLSLEAQPSAPPTPVPTPVPPVVIDPILPATAVPVITPSPGLTDQPAVVDQDRPPPGELQPCDGRPLRQS